MWSSSSSCSRNALRPNMSLILRSSYSRLEEDTTTITDNNNDNQNEKIMAKRRETEGTVASTATAVEEEGVGSENITPNTSYHFEQQDDDDDMKDFVLERKSFDQSSEWSQEEDDDTDTDTDGYSVLYSNCSEYSDSGFSTTTKSTAATITGPLLAKGSIEDWNVTTTTTPIANCSSNTTIIDASIITRTSKEDKEEQQQKEKEQPNFPSSSSVGTNGSNTSSFFSLPREEQPTPIRKQRQQQQNDQQSQHHHDDDDENVNPSTEEMAMESAVPSTETPTTPPQDNRSQVLVSTRQEQELLQAKSSTDRWTLPCVAVRLIRARRKNAQLSTPTSPSTSNSTSTAVWDKGGEGSGELELLLLRYQQTCQRLKSLVTSVQGYVQANHELQQARSNFLSDCEEMCHQDTNPQQQGEFVFRDDCRLSHDTTQTLYASRLHMSRLLSKVAYKATGNHHQDQQQQQSNNSSSLLLLLLTLVDYVIEWEDIVRADIGHQLSILTKLKRRKNWFHCTSRIFQFFSCSNRWTKRTYRKLERAQEVYQEKQREVVFLLQQVTVHGWKDLFPLIQGTLELELQQQQDVRMREEPNTIQSIVHSLDSILGQEQDAQQHSC